MSEPKRNYPVPEQEHDPRFTIGLLFDVERLIVSAGYPPLENMDRVDLQEALFRFLYRGVYGDG
ncbi:MAG: hypothetical protein OJJ54_13615 [Pseudonocardia sp.]|nr:hypothetical protein [Pseudonocardia sp.]